jgi:benzodiazapine receptor
MGAETARPLDSWPPGQSEVVAVVVGVIAVNVVGATPAAVSGAGSPWFQALTKPAIYPPAWLFGVAWTVMFTLLGAALALVWLADGEGRRFAFAAFAVQMGLNVAWSPAFFALRDLWVALAVIVALWVAIVGTIYAFDRVDRRAAALLVPYLLWVTFAAVLNYRFIAVN